jgi:hypothetical protein
VEDARLGLRPDGTDGLVAFSFAMFEAHEGNEWYGPLAPPLQDDD